MASITAPPAHRGFAFLDSIPPDPLARIVRDAQRAESLFDNDRDRIAELALRLAKRPDHYSQNLYRAIVLGDRGIGLAILDYCRLSAVERARVRASLQSRRRRYRTDERPPTDRQLDFLRRQHSAACPKTRREATEVIREIVQECRTGRRGREAAWER